MADLTDKYSTQIGDLKRPVTGEEAWPGALTPFASRKVRGSWSSALATGILSSTLERPGSLDSRRSMGSEVRGTRYPGRMPRPAH